MAVKEKVEKLLLKYRVSYFVKWERPRLFFGDKSDTFIFCVNQLQKETADEAIKELCDDIK